MKQIVFVTERCRRTNEIISAQVALITAPLIPTDVDVLFCIECVSCYVDEVNNAYTRTFGYPLSDEMLKSFNEHV